jgi:hypothetical protein
VRESIHDIVTLMARYYRAPTRVCAAFRQLKHDADILPKLQEQLETILEAYGKFQPIVYDTQGIKDDGSDVVLVVREREERDADLIGFQVKSFDDLQQKGYLQNLKAQTYESHNKIKGLSKYFIVLCTDPRAHKREIRLIEAEFKAAARTDVIEPEYAYTFLYMMPKTRIEALVKRTMEADDHVFKEALKSVAYDTPTARALVVFLSVHFVLTGSSLITLPGLTQDKRLRSIYEELRNRQIEEITATLDDTDEDSGSYAKMASFEGGDENNVNGEDDECDEDDDEEDGEVDEPVELDEFEPQLGQDLAELEDEVLETDNASDGYQILTTEIRALSAVALDALVRYEYNEEQLYAYMFNAMGIRD